MNRVASLLLLLSACAAPPPELLPVSAHFVIVRFYVDPSTRLGEVLDASDSTAAFDDALDRLSCEAVNVLVFQIESSSDQPNFGTVRLLLASAADAGDLCEGEAAVVIQPASWTDATQTEALVEGPLFIEGETLDGRIPIGGVRAAEAATMPNLFEVFPQWWEVSGRARGLERYRDPSRDPVSEPVTIQITDAAAEAVWRVQQLRAERVADVATMGDPEASILDFLVASGVQPDMDVDGDGLERFEDTDGDGRIDRCIEGVEVIDGPACVADPRFADGYAIRLIFRTVPVEVR